MQTQKIISKIKIVLKALNSVEKELLIWKLVHQMEKGISSEAGYAILSKVHELIRISELLKKDKDIVQILDSFGITAIINGGYADLITSGLVKGDKKDVGSLIRTITDRYDIMKHMWEPLEKLTTPDELKSDYKSKDIISLEIQSDDKRAANIETLFETTKLLHELYGTIAEIYGKGRDSKLIIIKIESGSSIKIDLKGSGEVIKQCKNAIIEIWSKIRNKRADEVIAKNGAVFNTLKVVEEINKQHENNTLNNEDAARLKNSVLSNTLDLFENGATISEIEPYEIVNNTKLLESFRPKLLPAPETATAVKTTKKKPTRKKTAKRKTTKKKVARKKTKK